MTAHSIYKLIHIVGILLVAMSLGGMIQYVANGGQKASDRWRKTAVISHGGGLLLILLGGFGMLARLAIPWPWPGWVIGKIAIWIVLGAAVGVVYRRPQVAKGLWIAIVLLGAAAAYLAMWKPF